MSIFTKCIAIGLPRPWDDSAEYTWLTDHSATFITATKNWSIHSGIME